MVGIDIGKNSFHIVGHDDRGGIVLRQKWSRSQAEARFANMRPCLIGMEADVGAHHLSRKLQGFGHHARLMPAQYVRPYSKGQKNDIRDSEAIAEAMQRPRLQSKAGYIDARCTNEADENSLATHGRTIELIQRTFLDARPRRQRPETHLTAR